MLKILSIGSIYVDINAYDFPVNKGLLPEQEVVGKKYELAPGGSAFNFARTCAYFGLKSQFIGKVGNDNLGNILHVLIQSTGVVPHLIQSDVVQTNIGINLTGPKGNTLMIVLGTANANLSIKDLKQKASEFIKHKKIDLFYLGGIYKQLNLISVYKSLIKEAQQNGIKVVLDHGRVNEKVGMDDRNLVQSLLPFVDYYLPSEDEFYQTWETEQISQAIKKVQRISDAVIVVKKGDKGANLFVKNEKMKQIKAHKVVVKSTVGAGDIFNSGFIFGLSQNYSLEKSVYYANAAAAAMISCLGLPDKNKIKVLMNNY